MQSYEAITCLQFPRSIAVKPGMKLAKLAFFAVPAKLVSSLKTQATSDYELQLK